MNFATAIILVLITNLLYIGMSVYAMITVFGLPMFIYMCILLLASWLLINYRLRSGFEPDKLDCDPAEG